MSNVGITNSTWANHRRAKHDTYVTRGPISIKFGKSAPVRKTESDANLFFLNCVSTAQYFLQVYMHKMLYCRPADATRCAVHFLLDLLMSSIGLAGGDDSGAANGHPRNSLSLNGQSGTASTAVEGTRSRGNGDSDASAQGGAHNASPDQERNGSGKDQRAATVQEGLAGNGSGAAGTNKESNTAKSAGRDTEGGDADSGHDGAAQMTETVTARKDTAAADAGAGKKKNKSKKKKKGR